MQILPNFIYACISLLISDVFGWKIHTVCEIGRKLTCFYVKKSSYLPFTGVNGSKSFANLVAYRSNHLMRQEMNSHTKHVVSADVGFGDVKLAWLDDSGKIQELVLPLMAALCN